MLNDRLCELQFGRRSAHSRDTIAGRVLEDVMEILECAETQAKIGTHMRCVDDFGHPGTGWLSWARRTTCADGPQDLWLAAACILLYQRCADI